MPLLGRLAAVLVLGTAVQAAGPPLDGPATVSTPAVRDVAWSVTDQCDLATAQALSARRPTVRQFVMVLAPSASSTTATLQTVVRTRDGVWRCQQAPVPARVGRNGVRPLLERRSGDGTTPAGVFPLGTVTAWDGQQFEVFGNRPDPGVRVRYRPVRIEDCWGATAGTPSYQHLVARRGCPGPDDEWLPRYGDVYSHAAVIGANLDPISGDQPGEPPYAAAIFLHRHSYDATGATRPTSGCVSVAYDPLVTTLTLLDPALQPHFAIGTPAMLAAG